MDLEKLYFEIKETIASLDFSKLWNGFEPLKFALYTDKECFFDGNYIEKSDKFIANTSIFYSGEWIAIWYVQEKLDPVILTSKIVHEMFHGFQMKNNDCRFPDELNALYNYKYDEENLSLKLWENRLIYNLSAHFDGDMFSELMQRRKYRHTAFPYAYHYEAGIEQIEGAANYVELNCLKQLSSKLFESKLSKMREEIINPTNLFPVRAICYDVGALLLYIMAENGISFDHGFSSESFSESIIKDAEDKIFASDNSIKGLLDRYNKKAAEIIRKAKEKNQLVTDESCDLLGVNVYNAIFLENHIISTYFVMFGNEKNQRIEYGDFVIETLSSKKVTKIYRI